MPNVRSLNKDKFNISDYRFRELYYFCLQYAEWGEALQEKEKAIKAVQYTALPTSGTPGNPTAKVAIECAEIARKRGAIEAAANAADPELKDFIIYAVTNEKVTFKFLKMQKNIPCESDRYYNSRRKFYFFLDKILREKNI